MKKWPWLILPLLICFLLLAEIFLGSTIVHPKVILAGLTGGSNETIHTLVWQYRLPRALTALIAGASLGICGLLLQSLFRNPLAGPSVLGVSAGAGFGAALLIMGGFLLTRSFGIQLPPAFLLFRQITGSLLGGIAVLLAILTLYRKKGSSLPTLILFGVTLGYITSAGVMILAHFSPPEEVQSYLGWTFGAFNRISGPRLTFFTLSLSIIILLSLCLSKSCNIMQMGETYSRSVGLNTKRTTGLILLFSALLSGLVTAFCGPIAFIGIAAPHLARMSLKTQNHQELLPGTLLYGACAALLADLITQLPGYNSVLPLNAVTALLGGPFLLILILKYRREGTWHL